MENLTEEGKGRKKDGETRMSPENTEEKYREKEKASAVKISETLMKLSHWEGQDRDRRDCKE